MLNHKVLHPNVIERVNVELACHFYSESTESALVHFSEEFGKDWLSTSRFIRLVCQFFNTVNNKSLFKAVQKRDASRKPVTKENRSQLNFLAAFLSWVQQWQAKQWKKAWVVKPFVLCYKPFGSYENLPTICSIDLPHVLLGKINLHLIEREFVVLRQLAGANFYLSMRQFIEG